MNPTFTVLLPVVRPPHFLPFSVASVLAQTRGDFELCIICDGAPWATIAFAEDAARRDPRVKVFAFPKGERHGEAHRHRVLQEARSDYVCQIGDDDLWMPNHLEEMVKLLAIHEFGNVLHLIIGRDQEPITPFSDLSDPVVIERMMHRRFNLFGPTAAGYRLSTYRSLPSGWGPAPEEIWTDLHMWRKFLSRPGISVGTRFVLTSIHLLTSARSGRSDAERVEEMRHYSRLIQSRDQRESLEQQLFRRLARLSTHTNLVIEDLRGRLATAEADRGKAA